MGDSDPQHQWYLQTTLWQFAVGSNLTDMQFICKVDTVRYIVDIKYLMDLAQTTLHN